jgi:hypothetical protein
MKIRTGFFFCIVLAIASVVVRVYQVLYVIDPTTGFYREGHLTVPLLNVLLLVAVILFLSFKVKIQSADASIDPGSVLGRGTGVGGAFVHYIVSLGFLFYVLTLLMTSHGAFSVGMLLDAALAILSSVFFIILGTAVVFGRPPEGIAWLSLFPFLWCAWRLIRAFLEYTTIANISSQLFDVLYMVSVLLFLFSVAKSLAGMPSLKNVIAFGFCTVLFAAVTAIPNLILLAEAPRAAVGLNNVAGLILDLLLMVYAIHVTRSMSRGKRPPHLQGDL